MQTGQTFLKLPYWGVILSDRGITSVIFNRSESFWGISLVSSLSAASRVKKLCPNSTQEWPDLTEFCCLSSPTKDSWKHPRKGASQGRRQTCLWHMVNEFTGAKAERSTLHISFEEQSETATLLYVISAGTASVNYNAQNLLQIKLFAVRGNLQGLSFSQCFFTVDFFFFF